MTQDEFNADLQTDLNGQAANLRIFLAVNERLSWWPEFVKIWSQYWYKELCASAQRLPPVQHASLDRFYKLDAAVAAGIRRVTVSENTVLAHYFDRTNAWVYVEIPVEWLTMTPADVGSAFQEILTKAQMEVFGDKTDNI